MKHIAACTTSVLSIERTAGLSTLTAWYADSVEVAPETIFSVHNCSITVCISIVHGAMMRDRMW